jgi:predicted hydrocarbon binding protein
MPVEMLSVLLSSEDEQFQKKLYSLVKQSVKNNLMKDMALEFGFKGDRLVNFLKDYFSSSGWGTIQVMDMNFSKSEAIVSVSDNPFVPFLASLAKKPVDSIFRGIFAGIFSKAFEKEVECIETHCSAIGAKECEFIIKPLNDFDLGNKATREQLEIEP